MKRDLLTILDLTKEEILYLLEKARKMKSALKRGQLARTLNGKILGLLFTKPSTRTRVSFEAGMCRLGGSCIFLTSKDTQLSRQEPLRDMARVLSGYIDALVVRTYAQEEVEQLARWSSIPVINGLTDRFHPCQVLSDLLTILEHRGTLENLKVAWIGDGNNVAHSWINAAAQLGFTLFISSPTGYWPDAAVLERARSQGNGVFKLCEDPHEAVASVDVINTDVWASMGKEHEADERRRIFAPYQVNSRLLSSAPPHAVVLHCLPAHRGEEITDEVIEGKQSLVFAQAENRLHFQMALMEWLLGTE